MNDCRRLILPVPVFVNLFASSTASLLVQQKPVEITQQNNYPWDGELKFTVSPKSPLFFSLMIRIPGWTQNTAIPSDLYSFENQTQNKVTITINGKLLDFVVIENGYVLLPRIWKKSDVVEVNLPMEVRRVVETVPKH